MERKLLLAIIFSTIIIITYSFYVEKFYPSQRQGSFKQRETFEQPAVEVATPKGPENRITTVSQPYHNSITTVSFENKPYQITFSNAEGAIKSVELKEFKNSLTGKTEILFDIDEPKEFSLAMDFGDNTPKIYQYEKGSDWIKFSYPLENKVVVGKYFKFQQDDYAFNLDISFENNTEKEINLNYSLVVGSRIDGSTSLTTNKLKAMDSRFVASSFLQSEKVIRDNIGKVKQNKIAHSGEFNWASLENKYFCIIVKPSQKTKSAFSNPLSDKMLQTGIDMESFAVPAHAKVAHNFLVYIGPKDIFKLSKYNLGFEKIIDFGFFGGISRLLLGTLRFFYKISRNYGIAIIMLSFLISVLLFPLSYKSFNSMKKIQVLQPKINELRKQLKDNPQKLNKEIMELYKKNRVNPFGGCLPMFLQMPIFIALYQGLIRSIELKGAKFLWIKDLSEPDRLLIFNFKLPVIGNSFNILPILIMIIMGIQQRFSSSVKTGDPYQDQQQKIFLLLMPLLFGMIFYNLPSGLVLYWFINSLFMMFFQLKIMKATS